MVTKQIITFIFIYFLVGWLVFWDGILLCNPGWPGFTFCLSLPIAEITDMYPHTQLLFRGVLFCSETGSRYTAQASLALAVWPRLSSNLQPCCLHLCHCFLFIKLVFINCTKKFHHGVSIYVCIVLWSYWPPLVLFLFPISPPYHFNIFIVPSSYVDTMYFNIIDTPVILLPCTLPTHPPRWYF
jgi:hypothetical protein